MAKKAKYEIIDKETDPLPYELMAECIEEWHEDLAECRIALLWAFNVKPDKDGRLVLGKCMPVSEHDRLLHGFARKIWFNKLAWDSEDMTRAKRLALMDHELSHIAPDVDDDSDEQKYDGHGLPIWRTVKHTIEDFHFVVARHGCYKADIAALCEAALSRDPNLNLFQKKEDPEPEDNVTPFRAARG